MNSSNYYIHGFTVGFQNDILWEMRREGDAITLGGSQALGFRVNYPQGADLICRRMIGYFPLRNAVQNLIRSPNPNQDPTLQHDILIILIMFIEAARFQWIFDMCNLYLTKGITALIDPWIEEIVKNWEKLSGIAARCHVEPLVLRSDERAFVDARETAVLFDEENSESCENCKRLG